MRSRNPSVSITVVDVVDPLKVDVDNIVHSKQEKEDEFPIGFVDWFITAHYLMERQKRILIILLHIKKIRKWMFMQCDIVAIYHYDLLPFTNISSYESMAKKGMFELIKIYDEGTNAIIKEKAKKLEGEDKKFYDRRINGDTYKEMADKLHVSVPRISQRTRMAISRLGRIVRFKLAKQGKLYSSRT